MAVHRTRPGDIGANDVQAYPAATPGSLLECAILGSEPICLWADQSHLGIVEFLGVPDSTDYLAAQARLFQLATEPTPPTT